MKNRKLLYHILFWLVFSTISLFVKLAELNWAFDIYLLFETYFKYLFAAVIFYTSTNFIFQKYFTTNKFAVIILLMILLFINGVFRHITFAFLFVKLGIFEVYGYDFRQSFVIGIWWWFFFTIFGFFYYIYRNHLKNVDNILKLQNFNLQLNFQNEQLTKQKIEADYNYLRTQINPHFLYNTLGYFYSKVAPIQPQTAEGILMLTNIMRYSLYQGDELGKVPLKMEIENLDNFIGLQKMRFGNSLYLEYEKNVNPGNEYKIIPHLLITIVENAFKHGNYTKLDHPLKVSIALLENKLVVKVENLINKAVSELPSTKTGLQNMQNRLLLVYGNKQNVEIKNDGNIFSIWMQIELNESVDKVSKESPQSNESVLNAKPENPNPFYKVAIL